MLVEVVIGIRQHFNCSGFTRLKLICFNLSWFEVSSHHFLGPYYITFTPNFMTGIMWTQVMSNECTETLFWEPTVKLFQEKWQLFHGRTFKLHWNDKIFSAKCRTVRTKHSNVSSLHIMGSMWIPECMHECMLYNCVFKMQIAFNVPELLILFSLKSPTGQVPTMTITFVCLVLFFPRKKMISGTCFSICSDCLLKSSPSTL